MVWRLWPEAKIFDEESFSRIGESYRNLIQSGAFLPGRNIERDIAEAGYALDIESWLDKEEYNRYLDETSKDLPYPEPEDL